MEKNEFVNGFANWCETFFLLTQAATLYLMQNFDNEHNSTNVLHEQIEIGGTLNICELMISWTNEFEELNNGRQWDGEWIEEINEFFRKKLEK